MDFEFLVDDRLEVISLEKQKGQLVIKHGETLLAAEVETLADGTVSFLVGGRSYLAYLGREGARIHVSVGDERVVLRPPGPEGRRRSLSDEAGESALSLVKAPMPGKVITLGVAEGEAVRKNQTLAIVEAMKMENEIKSPREAKVKRIFVSAGELVDADRPLLELEPLV